MDGAKLIYYLAYGSNLAAETFLGRRGIRPLSAVNVVVPSLRLRFDLPGIPYAEPCFANSGPRPGHDHDLPPESPEDVEEREAMLQDEDGLESQEYHKDRWQKGMVGVVYGLTPQDYAHVIATEGAGSSYKDVEVLCFPLNAEDKKIPSHPTTTPFQAHTLYARPETGEKATSERVHRPDPSYAQPSARYLKLIRDGAREHSLPQEYLDYLDQIRPFTITTLRQQIGKALFLAIWMPLVLTIFKIIRGLTDKDGRAPRWAQHMLEFVSNACWKSYDLLFKPVFGDGERTIGQGEDAKPRPGTGTAELKPVAILVESEKSNMAQLG